MLGSVENSILQRLPTMAVGETLTFTGAELAQLVAEMRAGLLSPVQSVKLNRAVAIRVVKRGGKSNGDGDGYIAMGSADVYFDLPQ